MTFLYLQEIIDRLVANDKKFYEILAALKARAHVYRVQDKPNSLFVRGLRSQIDAIRNHLERLDVGEKELKTCSETPVSFEATTLSDEKRKV